MRRLLKFLHTLGAAGFMGGMAALAVLVLLAPTAGDGAAWASRASAMSKIAAWIVMPAMLLAVLSGLLAIAAHPGFHDAGWAWIKAATGILVVEGALHVLGPLQDEAKRATAARALAPDPTSVAQLLAAERNTLWVLLAVSAANIALAIWRPRLARMGR